MSSSQEEVPDQDREPAGSTRGRLIGVSVALVVAVAIVLVTGLAWPDWLSGNDESRQPTNAALTPNPDTSSAPGGQSTSRPTPSEPSKPSPSKPRPAPRTPAGPPPGGADRGGGQQPGPEGQPQDAAQTRAARAAMQAYADAVSAKNIPKLVDSVCELTQTERMVYLKYFRKQFSGGKATMTLYGPTKTRGPIAQTRAKSVVEKSGDRNANAITITMQLKDNRWCIPSRR